MVLMAFSYILIIFLCFFFFLKPLSLYFLVSFLFLSIPSLWLHVQCIHRLFFLPSTTWSLASLSLSLLPQSHTHVWTHTWKHKHSCGYMCTCNIPCTCMHTHIPIACTHISAYSHPKMQTQVCTYTGTHKHSHTNTYACTCTNVVLYIWK